MDSHFDTAAHSARTSEHASQDSRDTDETVSIGMHPRVQVILRHLGATLANLDLSTDDRERISEATMLAIRIHSNQEFRPERPYAIHVLRVTQCFISQFGVTDPDLIIATLLHDSVRDQAALLRGHQPEEMDEKEAALATLEGKFGPRVASTIRTVTGPDFDALARAFIEEEGDQRSVEVVKEELYQSHVLALASSNLDAFLIMLSDIADYIPSPGRRTEEAFGQLSPTAFSTFLADLATYLEPLRSSESNLGRAARQVVKKIGPFEILQ